MVYCTKMTLCTWCLTSTETVRLIRDGEKGGYGGGGRGRLLYLSLHCYHQNDSCIKMGSDESHFTECFVNCEGRNHKTVSTDHSFGSERRAEADSNRGPSAYRPTALPLGQTGSHRTPYGHDLFRTRLFYHTYGARINIYCKSPSPLLHIILEFM